MGCIESLQITPGSGVLILSRSFSMQPIKNSSSQVPRPFGQRLRMGLLVAEQPIDQHDRLIESVEHAESRSLV